MLGSNLGHCQDAVICIEPTYPLDGERNIFVDGDCMTIVAFLLFERTSDSCCWMGRTMVGIKSLKKYWLSVGKELYPRKNSFRQKTCITF